jgi:hypothetical protein
MIRKILAIPFVVLGMLFYHFGMVIAHGSDFANALTSKMPDDYLRERLDRLFDSE